MTEEASVERFSAAEVRSIMGVAFDHRRYA